MVAWTSARMITTHAPVAGFQISLLSFQYCATSLHLANHRSAVDVIIAGKASGSVFGSVACPSIASGLALLPLRRRFCYRCCRAPNVPSAEITLAVWSVVFAFLFRLTRHSHRSSSSSQRLRTIPDRVSTDTVVAGRVPTWSRG